MHFDNGFGRVVTLVLISLIVLVPIMPDLAMAQTTPSSGLPAASDTQPDPGAACAKAKSDAERATTGVWFFAGGCLGITGILIAYLLEPSPPVTELLGKEPGYVAVYTDCYKSAGKSAQGKKAVTGCLILGAVEVAVYVVLLAAVASSESESGLR